MSESKTNYVWSDGVLLRMDDRAVWRFSIYRGQGHWERWYDLGDWLHGTPLSDEDAARRIEQFDRQL